ncbi:MAG TPA: putative toxin-antitoxin system toxin component, PIN family [Acidobacteriaceae bacterium]|nr:putative toxin-antitoxin system toxin component, PIN family [Acidobacteriaceae bacterium]
MTAKPRRVVLDTNVLVSRVILPGSQPARAADHVALTCELLISSAMIAELEAVFRRPKLDRYTNLETRLRYLWTLVELAKPILVVSEISDCRDEKDNKLLALALDGRGDTIVTGDQDLLCLHPWRGVAILSPADYLALRG